MLGTSAAASGITKAELFLSEDMGRFNGVSFRRYHGVVHGTVDRKEDVEGLAAALGNNETLSYSLPFEIIAPAEAARANSIIVEVENRGRPTALGLIAGFALSSAVAPADVRYPAGMGNGFPFRAGVAYARVTWQASLASSIPTTAQGVGLVALRDFGRMLGGAGATAALDWLPTFKYRVLIGISQSAWMANALVAEGFNRDPATGKAVYQGLFTRSGTGNVLAVNKAAGGGQQAPYPLPDATPLTPSQLLRRPDSDPIVVDVATYTDFYRLRASVFAGAPGVRGLHRYAVAAAHAPAGAYPDALIFETLRCNGGVPVPLSPLNDAAHVRALLTGLLSEVGVKGLDVASLPRARTFDLVMPGDAPINLLPGGTILVPRVDANALPVGGIPMVEAALPLGKPTPPAISPVSTRSINDVCGNFGGWTRFTPDEVRARYGSLGAYRARTVAMLDAQVSAGWLLPSDLLPETDRIINDARKAFDIN